MRRMTEGGRIPIGEVIIEKMKAKRGSRDDGKLGEINGCSTVSPRRSSKLVRMKAKRAGVARWGLEFVEPKEYMESDDSDSVAEFLNDEDCSENSSDGSAEPEESDTEVNYKGVMDCIGCRRNANAKDWKYEAEMLSAFAEEPELCFKALCAIYRKQTEEE